MNKRLLILSTFLAVGVSLFGQQDKLLTHFVYDKMSLNPGATGVEVDGVCGTSVYRNQWDKVNGAPNSAILNVEANIKRWLPAGVGISFFHDAIGFNRQNSVLLNYSHHLINKNGNVLGVGAGIGLMNLGLAPTWVPPSTMLDASLPTGFSGNGLDVNLGVFYKSNLGFYGGLSLTHLNAARLTYQLAQSTYTIGIDRHFYLMGGYKREIGTNNAIDAQLLVRSTLHQTSIDVNARFMYGTLGYAGLTFRNSDAVALMLGYNLPSLPLTIGYSYDYTINKLSSISRGSHEILIKYCRPIPVPPIAVSRHPRWL